MTTFLPALPEPQSATLPTLRGACEAVVEWAETCDDLGTVREVYDKFAAIAEYLTRNDAAREANTAMRRLEQRIGMLLGPAPGAGARTDLTRPHEDRLPHNREYEFRQLAAHPDIVDEVIAESTESWQVVRGKRERVEGPGPASRTQILARIAERKLDAVRDVIRADAATQARSDREEFREFERSVTPDDYDPEEDRHSVTVQRAIHTARDGILHLADYTAADVRRALNHSNPKVRNIVFPAYTDHLRTIVNIADRFRELLP